MNKRQKKKAMKKISYPLVDEMNLLTLSPKEYDDAMNDFKSFLWNNCRYYHYRDKYNPRVAPFSYHFPVGESFQKYINEILRTTRSYNCTTCIPVEIKNKTI